MPSEESWLLKAVESIASSATATCAKAVLESYLSRRSGLAKTLSSISKFQEWEKSFDEIKALDLPTQVKANLEVSLLGTNVYHDLIRTHSERLENEANVLRKATETLPPNTEVHPFIEDFIDEFSEYAQRAREANARNLWAALLNVEAQQPGSISKRTMSELRLFSASDGETLRYVASRTIEVNGRLVLVFPKGANDVFTEMYKRASHLGLVDTSVLIGDTVVLLELEDRWQPVAHLLAGGQVMAKPDVKMARPGADYPGLIWSIGSVGLTQLGKELVRLPVMDVPDDLLGELLKPRRAIAIQDGTLKLESGIIDIESQFIQTEEEPR